MGEDFVALMRQAYRKDDVDVTNSYLALFDFMSLEDWVDELPGETCRERRALLKARFYARGRKPKYLLLVPRHTILARQDQINIYHHQFVEEGYEGIMVKDLEALYRRGRGYEVMKVKSFHDFCWLIWGSFGIILGSFWGHFEAKKVI